MIKVRNLSSGYGGQAVLQDINLEFPAGTMTAVLGPNGSGKTTLVSSISGVLKPLSGQVEIQGRDVRDYRPRELAEIMAVLPQKVDPAFGLTVKSMVMMGRYAHGSGFFGYNSEDEYICADAIRTVGISHLADRPVSDLSGGEFQRVLMARTVAQQARIMVLDEAASGVDVAGKIELFDLLRRMNRKGATIVCVIHDLNLASLYFERLVFLSRGRVMLDGSPQEVITGENISNVYKTSVAIVEHPQLGVPQVLFLLAAISIASPVQAGVSITDDFGTRVELNEPARRIVALYGSFNEVLYAMKVGDRLVGRTAADHYPEQIVNLPSIGTHMRPNPELIVALKPDLVLQMAGRSQAATSLDPLRARGISCAMFKVASFDELFSMISRIGVLTGEVGRAAELNDSMAARLVAVGKNVLYLPDHLFFLKYVTPICWQPGRDQLLLT